MKLKKETPIRIVCMLFFVHRMKWMAVMLAALVLVTLAMAEGEIWEEDDHEVLIRSERGAKKRGEILRIKISHALILAPIIKVGELLFVLLWFV